MRISEELGGLPLALDQAGERTSLKQYVAWAAISRSITGSALSCTNIVVVAT